MADAYWVTGDTREVMAQLPPASVDLVLTSPPFMALRSYLPSDDPQKHLEMGSEATPGEFIDGLLDVTEAAARLLTPHGSLVVELGDTYSGSGGGGGDYLEGGMRDGQQQFAGSAASMRESNAAHWRQKNANTSAWPLAKSLCLIPELYRIALVYGFNPLTGRTTEPWRARNVIRWVRANPPVGALGDKFRPATSEMVVACKAKDRWFDLDAVRQPPTAPMGRVANGNQVKRDGGGDECDESIRFDKRTDANPAGAPPLDWWLINPTGYPGAHYATWPAELLTRPIEAICPRRVCRACGQPSRRIVDCQRLLDGEPADLPPISTTEMMGEGASGIGHWRKETDRTTTGWTTCGCPGGDGIRLDGWHTGTAWRPGIVLDPFCGSGTTLSVASGHGRDSIGIDLDERNLHLARQRVGMFLTETTATELSARLEPASEDAQA